MVGSDRRRGPTLVPLLVIAAFILLTAPSVHAGYLDLSWNPPTTRVDGTGLNDLAGYRVYFGTTSPACLSSSYQDVPSPTPAPSPGDVVQFRLEGLEAGVPYSVQVSAFDQTGNESLCSNEVNAPANAGGASESGGGGGGGGGCFIATAAYGSALEPHVAILRRFRDRYLEATPAGRALVNFYYRVSPGLAERIRGSESLRWLTRGILWPVVGLAWLILFHVWIPITALIGATAFGGWLRYRDKYRISNDEY